MKIHHLMAIALMLLTIVARDRVGAAPVELFVDPTKPAGALDLSAYSLGQGGLSHEPMFDGQVDQIAALHPHLIRLFVQEYFSLYPEPGRYHWETLDRSIETILATGAKPLLSLCFKPSVLYPKVDPDSVRPNDYAEWDELIFRLVQHCNREKGYGIELWEVGNEGDIGESGGCPYRFKPQEYVEYYTHCAAAILRADPTAKVGGPALADYRSALGDALIKHCGNGSSPLHFFSWHMYANDPLAFQRSIREIKAKLAQFPRLASTETIIDEWNIALIAAERATGFQAAFVLENTLRFHNEGLSRSAYYHIRDYRVDPVDFQWMSPRGLKFMADWWNVSPQNSGLFDNQGRRRPAYYAFQMLRSLSGDQLRVEGATNIVHTLAARQEHMTHIVFWNFPLSGPSTTNEVVLRLPPKQIGQFRLLRLDAVANRLEELRTGNAAELADEPIRVSLAPYGVAWLQLGEFRVRASWGYRSPAGTAFSVRAQAATPGLSITNTAGWQLEPGEDFRNGAWQTRAGGGDVDGIEFSVSLPQRSRAAPRREQSIWTQLLKESDADTAQRLRHDPAFEVDPPMLTFQLDEAGTKGCSVGLDQLWETGAIWIPSLDLYLATREPFEPFEAHQRALGPLQGRRILERVEREPEANYSQFAHLWPDMGNPTNPHPTHVVGVSWDSALPKFGIDRLAGVKSDLGNPDQIQFACEFPNAHWQGQRLTDALPVILTAFASATVRFEIEQFAYPLDGPPIERRGDIAMVLLQKISVTNVTDQPQHVPLKLRHAREFAEAPSTKVLATNINGTTCFLEPMSNTILFTVESPAPVTILSERTDAPDPKRKTVSRHLEVLLAIDLLPHAQRDFWIKLPSPPAGANAQKTLVQLDYAAARVATLRFWSDYLDRGAVFRVPDQAVNDLFRANLWHALLLPRRRGGAGTNLTIDLPYSNFAYGQFGTPWPVNQAVYVDYMLYDLRGYPDISSEELLAMYRNNQESNGRVGGFANWGVYTPSMLYSVAQHYLLSHDRSSFERLLPATLKALDWCLEQVRQAKQNAGSTGGLFLAPLNDLSHEPHAWAFNQAYLFAGVDTLAQALERIQHPRASECRAAAREFQRAVEQTFTEASIRAPVVELRDHTWSPYIPSDALTPRRLLELWYPTDVDTGPLHLPRLKAIDPNGPLTTALLNDHEDNLFLKGLGMANEPVYNQQGMVYLLRDDPKAAIRVFYSMMACAFSQTVFEPVEHRWGWGQFFGPPSTDGAWFELYRHMLIHEREDGSLVLAQATPRAWLEDGKRIEVERAPSYCGPVSLHLESRSDSGRIRVDVGLGGNDRPRTLLVRARHPSAARIRHVELNDRRWSDFDAEKEWVRIPQPSENRYRIELFY